MDQVNARPETVEITPNMTLKQWRNLIDRLRRRYGADARMFATNDVENDIALKVIPAATRELQPATRLE